MLFVCGPCFNMPISISEIKKIASLARISLTPEEEIRHAETISVVLDYMKILGEVQTDRIEPTVQVTGLKNVYREDEVSKATNKEALVAIMPSRSGKELKVPGVFVENQ